MNRNFLLTPFHPIINLFIVTFFLLAKKASCTDPYFLACNPKTCGDGQNISFPFYIQNEQEPFCGYPGFNISCNKGKPVVKLSSNEYIVHKIFYQNQSLRVSNAAVFGKGMSCIPPIQNMSLADGRFQLSSKDTSLFLLYHCNSSLLVNDTKLLKYKVDCVGGDETVSTLAMLDHDPLLGSALEKCETGVVAPVESYRGENVGIERVLERGFLLNWTASNCSTCEKSGGKCGFNFSTYHFKCFCPDRPHARHCNSESVLSAESKYEACKPANCSSGLEISYPFYIRGNGTEFCGHPGFGILCQEGRPIYKTSGASYIIQDITYENHSFRLVNLDVINTTCPIPSLNYSFDRSSVDFIPHHADIYFFYNCTKSFTVNYTMSRVTCGATAINKTYAALVPRDEDLNWDKSVCESVVAAPIQLEPEEANQTIRDVDYKRLLKDGFTLKWIGLGKYCPHCQRSGGRCGFEGDTSVCFCDDGSHPKHCYDENDKLGLKLGLGLGIGCPFVGLILLSYIYRHRFKKRRDSSNLLSMNSSSDPSSKADLEGDGGYFGIPIFSYTELEQATNNFDCEKELGDGGFGTVYYGKLKDGREVAVKRLYEHNYKRVQQFMNEIEILTRLRHKHLVCLYGCTSRRSRELLLVYEFIPNGTVADHLHGDQAMSSPLTWPIRMSIAIETASALAYLHASDIIHRDVKTNNILLDRNFCVKVADFGLSRLFPNDATHVSTVPQGTPGYVDPEYHQSYQLTDKSDVYSFGVVLIELISSMAAVDISRHRHEINLSNLAISKIQKRAFDELIDSCLGYNSDEEVKRMTTSVAELAFQCLQQDKEMRPSMENVLQELKIIQGGESMENPEEVHDDDKRSKNTLPPPSPPCCDEAGLLENIRLPPSPVSVTAKWVSSCSTTPNGSG